MFLLPTGSIYIFIYTSWMWSGLDIDANWWGNHEGRPTPGLSPYSDVDLEHTLWFTRVPGVPWIARPPQALTITAYTDQPDLWKSIRYRSVMRLTRWYLARCQIHLKIPKLRTLPPGTLSTPNGLVRWQLPMSLAVTKDPGETFIFLTRTVDYEWGAGSQRQRYRLLGVSASVRFQQSRGPWTQRPAVWVRSSPIFTTLVHELGHRLGLPHVISPYRLMLTGSGVRHSLRMLWTSFLGYVAPERFLFSPQECHQMHQTLHKERPFQHKSNTNDSK